MVMVTELHSSALLRRPIAQWDGALPSAATSKAFLLFCALHASGTSPDQPPALLAFAFRDAAGRPIESRPPGLRRSSAFGAFLYLGENGQSGVISRRLRITPPQGAAGVQISLFGWRARELRPLAPMRIKAPPETAHLRIGKAELTLGDANSCLLTAEFEVSGADSAHPPALAALAFFDAEGAVFDGPIPGLPQSELYGPFVYLGAPGEAGLNHVEAAIALPPGAARLEAEILRWRAERVILTKPPILSLRKPAAPASTPRPPAPAPPRPSAPLAPFAKLDREVRPGAAYDVEVRALRRQTLKPRFALASPRFYAASGVEIPSPQNLPISARLGGPYRYLAPCADDSGVESRAVASFVAPAQAVRMSVDLTLWEPGGDLGALEASCLACDEGAPIAAEGRLDLAGLPAEIVLRGEVAALGEPKRRAGQAEILFETAQGEPVLDHAPGLEQTNRRLNLIWLDRLHGDDRIPLHVVLSPPPAARRMLWRLRPAEGQSLRLARPFAATPFSADPARILAGPPAAATAAPRLGATGAARLRPPSAFWENVARGRLTLLAEALCAAAPRSWIEIACALDLRHARSGAGRLGIRPTYFDAQGLPLAAAALTGCVVSPLTGGPARFASAEAPKLEPLSLRECFLTPPDAAFAGFHVFSFAGGTEAVVSAITATQIAPDEVFARLDPSGMDRERAEQALQIAEALGDLPAREKLATVLSARAPKDPQALARARALQDDLVDLDLNWLPALPKQPPFTAESSTVLHLLKVIYPDENSGGAVRSASIVEAQATQGLRPIVCMPLNSPRPALAPPAQDGIHVVRRNGVEIHYPHYPGLQRRRMAPAALLSLETALGNRVARQTKAALIHAASGFRGYENALKGLALARANDLPLVYEARSFHEHTWRPIDAPQMGDSVTKLRMAQENRCMAEADAVVTISQAMMANLRARGVAEEKLFFAPNAIDPLFEARPSAEEIARLRRSHGLFGAQTIGYISNFSQREGHMVLLEAFARLAAAGSSLRMVLVGDGPERSRVLEQAVRLGLADRIAAPGNVDHAEVRTWCHAIDLFVVPRIPDFASDYVTPLKPFEAMAQGIPVIMSDRPVTAEIAGAAQERARIFPAGDAEALAALIVAELAAPEELRRRAERARAWVMAERVWRRVARFYEPAYEAARRHHARKRRCAEGDAR